MTDLSGRRRLPRVGLGGNRTPLTLGDPGAVNFSALCIPTLCSIVVHTHVHTHTMLFHGTDRGTVCPTLSSQWSICAHPQAVAVLQVPLCATASEAHGQWCTVRDMMYEVRAEPLDHRTRSAGLNRVHPTRSPGGGGGIARVFQGKLWYLPLMQAKRPRVKRLLH